MIDGWSNDLSADGSADLPRPAISVNRRPSHHYPRSGAHTAAASCTCSFISIVFGLAHIYNKLLPQIDGEVVVKAKHEGTNKSISPPYILQSTFSTTKLVYVKKIVFLLVHPI